MSFCLCQYLSIRLNKALCAVWHLLHLRGQGYIPAIEQREKGSAFIRLDSNMITIALCDYTPDAQIHRMAFI